jgi:hypothetical protein
VKLRKIHLLDPVVIVKAFGLHPVAIDGGYPDPTLLVGSSRGSKVVDPDAMDRLDGKVVLRKPIRGRVMQDVWLLTDILAFIPLDVSDGGCN